MCVIDRPEKEGETVRGGLPRELVTPRLRLRPPEPADTAALARLAGDYAIACMTTRMPHPYAEADARQFVELVGRQDRTRENTFVIEDGEGLVGAIGFHRPPGALLEMGYWIGRPFWGRGYATEASRAALDFARDDWRRKVVVAGHFADNPASGQVLLKCGFLYTGEVQTRHSRARRTTAPTRMMVWLA